METITYLVANYNQEKFVEDCLLSLKGQTCDRWRCVICDDKSTDRSVEIIEAHADPRIRLLKNETNIGYTKTLKRLIEAAPSDIVGILDADDALEKDATASVLEIYDNDENAGFVHSKCAVMSENMEHKLGEFGQGSRRVGEYSALTYLISHLKTFRKRVYYKTSGLDENMHYAEDRDLVYKLEEISRPIYIDRVLYKYRQVPNSISRSADTRKIGFQNHYKAVKNALRRRKIRGLNKKLHLIRIRLLIVYYLLGEWRFLQLFMGIVFKFLGFLNRRINTRYGGF